MKTNTHRRTQLKMMAAAVGLCLGIPSIAAHAADGKRIMIRFAGTLPVAHHITKAQEYFKKLVEERSKGRITVQVYPAGQLYKDVDLVDVIPKGSLEMAIANLGQWSGLVPQMAIFDLTGNWHDRDHFYRAQDDGKIRDVIAKAMAKKDVHLLNTIDYGEGTYITNKPLKTMEDFKGMRIRASTEYNTIQVQTLGGASSLISSAEVYQGLSLGTIDGAITGPSSFISRKLYEVAKYDMNSSQGYGNFGTVVSLKWWNTLPQDVKDLLTAAGKETEAWCRKAAQTADAQAWEKLAAVPGNVVYKVEPAELDRWRKVMMPPQVKLFKERAGQDADVLLERVEATRNP
ncbi:MAG TPA: TRAP transporter substrate-binding protein DctP [Noviherbaspirillum sp.]|uniref:TRAP transporter substrate-binding protein n=1 Tax=Noviherbaspirillum sp. TaxID=1926288 RepID=UPI002B46FE6B|nr:TRAP transporter substrate-binding protein DctP [Noviherbaspirillum sp.]HJV84179.1 TRAP transporter substrate-binding protein DctP [Noviherbaspirillum sp.]